MLTPYEKRQIVALNQTLSRKVEISVIETDHECSRSIRRFGDTLSQLVPKIRIKHHEGESNELPAIRVHRGLIYHAVPSGTELGPFIEVADKFGCLRFTAVQILPGSGAPTASFACLKSPHSAGNNRWDSFS